MHIQTEQKVAVAILKKRLPDTPTNWRGILMRKINGVEPLIDSVESFRFVWLQQLKLCREHIATANLMGGSFSYNSTSKQYHLNVPFYCPLILLLLLRLKNVVGQNQCLTLRQNHLTLSVLAVVVPVI